jgi:hypothetical protein
MLGKKLYKTSMLNILRLLIFAMVLFFFNDFVLDTYTYEKFQADGRFKFIDVLMFHYKYPKEFITFFLLIIFPAYYYAFFRGIKFFEKGFVYNRGLPFLNRKILYSDVALYKLIHPKNILIVQTIKGEVFLVADNNLERVIAILDQHNIKGDLAKDGYVNLLTNLKRFILIVLSFTLLMFLMKKFGVFAQ